MDVRATATVLVPQPRRKASVVVHGKGEDGVGRTQLLIGGQLPDADGAVRGAGDAVLAAAVHCDCVHGVCVGPQQRAVLVRRDVQCT